MIDLRQTKKYAEYMQATGWGVEKNADFFTYYKKVPVLGYFIKIQRPGEVSKKQIDSIIKKYKPFQMVIEPKNKQQVPLLKKNGFKQSISYFVPSKTVQIDLTKAEKYLLDRMHYKTRYNIRKTEKSELKVKTGNNIRKFADFWQECARQQRGMYLSQKEEIIQIHKAFGKDAEILTVYKKEELLSEILLICTKDIAYYMYATSSAEGKKTFAPTLNVWEAVKLAKKLKCKVFDFEGIYDERFPIKSWLGFTRFKKSFGGEVVEYPGTFQKFLLPFSL
jgi:lipid II:glycine glycyltransferase (peptidoglycan interpeptide bridge formation enzyme)